VIAKAATP